MYSRKNVSEFNRRDVLKTLDAVYKVHLLLQFPGQYRDEPAVVDVFLRDLELIRARVKADHRDVGILLEDLFREAAYTTPIIQDRETRLAFRVRENSSREDGSLFLPPLMRRDPVAISYGVMDPVFQIFRFEQVMFHFVHPFLCV